MKSPASMSLDELRPYAAEYASRIRLGTPTRPRIEQPCVGCGKPLSARERRKRCKFCGARNPRPTSQAGKRPRA